MAHPHSLHSQVMVDCLCCHLPKWFIFKARSDQVICQECLPHYGDGPGKAARRERSHDLMWRTDREQLVSQHESKVRLMEREHEAEVISLRDQLAAARARVEEEITSRPTEIVERVLGQEFIRDAHDMRDAAYRSRDRVIRIASELRLAHRDRGNGKCRCGRAFDYCPDQIQLGRMSDLIDRWEAREIRRHRIYGFCDLPQGHPALIDPKFDVDELEDDDEFIA